MSTKKGPYRKLVKIEMLEDYSRLSKGNVIEVHPVMAKRLEALNVAKKTTKELSNPQTLPSSNIKGGEK